MSDPSFCSLLDSADIRAAAAQTYSIWGGRLSVRAHCAQVMRQMDEGATVVRYAGLLGQDGQLLASLKRYRLKLTDGAASYDAVGLGAIFTAPSIRKRGLAAQLIEATLAEATAEGCKAALLFSDIAPSYYERFGFVELPAALWSARRSALPNTAPLQFDPVESDHQLVEIYANSWSTELGRLRVERQPSSYRHAQLRHGPHRGWLLRDGGDAIGYLLAQRDGETLWIVDLALSKKTAPTALLATLRKLSEKTESKVVGGWLRGAYAVAPFLATARSRCIPMVAWLRDCAPADTAPSHFAWLDHF